MALSRWFGRFAIGANNDSFLVDATAKTCTAGNYYLRGYTAEATSQLCEHLTTLVAAVVASSTVTYSATSGKVTITWGSDSHSLTWTDTDLRDLLGFTGNIASAAGPFEATNEPQYVWSPDVAMSDAPVSPLRIVQPVSSTRVHVSRDGTLTTTRGNTRYAADVEYQLLDGARVFIPSTGSVNKELEQFFDVIAAGEPIRLYPDRTLNVSTSFVTVRVAVPGGEEIGAFDRFARKRIRAYQGLADVQIPVVKDV